MSTARKKSVAKAKKAVAPKAAAAPKKVAPAASAPSKAVGLEEIKALIALVSKEAFQEFEFEAGELKFRIRKDGGAPVMVAAPAPIVPTVFGSPVAHVPAQSAVVPAPAPAAPAAPAEEVGIHYITSPIVGTFYRSANPTAPSFVNPGDRVRPGQTLCIVEAMKLMNEIECDIAGEVVRVLVENGQPVEYGERLFAVKVG
ncbi:MAG TPA: acetyl-CoA carboxylase biotin carboxyl carrier protein [Holophagaceae bacterium]|nr:acetyl-CoA carboxylase biotin carboxyl carrier protein [Holophagaceae bacterium]